MVLILTIAAPAYAVDITISLTDEQYDAMSVLTSTPEEWVQNAATNKANKTIDVLVKSHSTMQPDKITKEEKNAIISTIDLKKEKEKRSGKKK